jgi:hypothetical protein
VGDGVRRRLGDDQFDGVIGRTAVRPSPGVHLLGGEPSGEAGAARGRAEPEEERRFAVVIVGAVVVPVAVGSGVEQWAVLVRMAARC